MESHKIYILVLFIASLFCACTGTYSVQEYIELVNKNESYTKEVSDGLRVISCKYIPTNLLAIQEISKASVSKKDKELMFLESKLQFQNSAYFLLTLSMVDGSNILMKDVSDQTAYAMKLNFMTTSMDQCFFAIQQSGDTVKAYIYEYQRSYGNSPNATMLFAFPKKRTIESEEKELQFFYKDKILGMPNVVRLTFDNSKLKEDDIKIIF